jgi:hypothetical protein
MKRITVFRVLICFIVLPFNSFIGLAQENKSDFLKDRGTGISTSIFGTYVRKGELIVYPFFEYSSDHNMEYPLQFSPGNNNDFRGRFRGYQEQIFISYGLTNRFALEFEVSHMNATFRKSLKDTSPSPAKIEESGFGDIEGELRFCFKKENEHFPEIFGYVEILVPSNKNKVLIGDSNWDLKPGIGLIKGFDWGTMTIRADLEYNMEGSNLDIGEFAIEYLKRLSPSLRLNLSIDGGEGGAPDEWVFNSGIQWRISDHIFFKFDNSLGFFSKSMDWAPQAGLLFSIPFINR